MRNIFTYLCILYGFLLIVPTILGYFQKKTSRIILIESSNHVDLKNEDCQLCCHLQMRNLKISSKTFKMSKIKRFEVIQRKKGSKLQWYCALIFQSGKYLTITTTLDAPLAFHYAKKLNELLVSNTSLEKEVLEEGLIPYIPIKEQKKIKYIKSIRLILTFITVLFLILAMVLFAIGNVELLPTIVIMFVGVFVGVLLIMALNGATFDSL